VRLNTPFAAFRERLLLRTLAAGSEKARHEMADDLIDDLGAIFQWTHGQATEVTTSNAGAHDISTGRDD